MYRCPFADIQRLHVSFHSLLQFPFCFRVVFFLSCWLTCQNFQAFPDINALTQYCVEFVYSLILSVSLLCRQCRALTPLILLTSIESWSAQVSGTLPRFGRILHYPASLGPSQAFLKNMAGSAYRIFSINKHKIPKCQART